MGPARRRRVRELAYGVGDAAPHRRAVVIVLRRKFIGAGGAFLHGLGPYRFSIRFAARQMSISGITLGKLLACDLQTFNTKDCICFQLSEDGCAVGEA